LLSAAYIVGQTGFLMNLRPRPVCSWPSGRQDIRHRNIQVANGLDTGCQRHGWLIDSDGLTWRLRNLAVVFPASLKILGKV